MNMVFQFSVPYKAGIVPWRWTKSESGLWCCLRPCHADITKPFLQTDGLFDVHIGVMRISHRPSSQVILIPDVQVAVVRALCDLPKNCETTAERFDINVTYATRLDISFSENIRYSCMLCKSNAKTEYDLHCRLVEEVYPKLLDDYDKHFTSIWCTVWEGLFEGEGVD